MKQIIPNTKKCYIYALFDPRNLQLRYIGKTVNDLSRRQKEHINETKRKKGYNHYKENWIQELLNEDLEPAIEILEECNESNWQEIEKAWIKECREKELPLTNILNGGNGGPTIYGKKHSEQTKEKIRNSLIGHFVSDETKQKQRDAKKGKKLSDEHKRKIAKSNIGRPGTMLGKTQSIETRNKISNALKGIKRSDEFCEKIRQSWVIRKQKIEESK